mmetsp:Transcript_16979/g.16851  ORF Transcript_16979/g.16851 Transcript_16979/m.16851 type:complete len:152 (-) Transcript_16979:75-530(-)
MPKQLHRHQKDTKAAVSKGEDEKEAQHEKELRRLRRSHPLGRVVNRKCNVPLLGMSAKGINYRGIVNLMGLLLLALNLRLVLENLIKYGILLRPWVLLCYLQRFLLITKKHLQPVRLNRPEKIMTNMPVTPYLHCIGDRTAQQGHSEKAVW